MSGLPISGIVQVNLNVIPGSPIVGVGCNKGLIIGESEVITLEQRATAFESLGDMISAGFDGTEPEYLAAQIYFAQRPAPKMVYIGRMDSTEAAGVAVAACLEVAHDAYGVYICGAADADIESAIVPIEADGRRILFFETANTDSVVITPTVPDIFSVLVTAKSERAIGIYSAVPYAGAALLGLAMGKETGEQGSAFSLSYAKLNNVATQDITKAQYTILMNKNGNVFALRGQDFQLLHMGRCVDGIPYDDRMYLDMTQNLLEAAVMNVMTENAGKIPQTDAGMAIIVAAVAGALERMREIGYIAEGVWNGDTIGELDPGDVLAGGYMVIVSPFATLSQADREARKAPPVTVALKTSGTIESVVINVNVNL